MPALLVVYKPYDLSKTPIKQEQVKIDQIPVKKIETPKTSNDDRNKEPVKEPVQPISTPVNTDERADTPVKEKVSPVEETPTVNVEAPIELTPAFIDITKITPEQKIRLQNSVIGVKPDELIAKSAPSPPFGTPCCRS